MMKRIEFFAQGEPKGQPRPKAFARGGIASVYDPGTAEGWKSQVAEAARPYLPEQPHDCCISLALTFYFPRPKNHYRTGRMKGVMRADAPAFHTKTPDADNLAKAVMDALTILRMWKDDAQVVRLLVRKYYTAGGSPGCNIVITEEVE